MTMIFNSFIILVFSFWRIPGGLCCFQHLCLQVILLIIFVCLSFCLSVFLSFCLFVFFSFILICMITLSYSMVGSIGAIGFSLNLAPLLEV